MVSCPHWQCANYEPDIGGRGNYSPVAIEGQPMACERCLESTEWGCTGNNPYWPIVGCTCDRWNPVRGEDRKT